MIPIYIAIGGAIGSVLRYFTSNYFNSVFKFGFPAGTLAVNVIGSLAMGLIIGYLVKTLPHSNEMRAFLTVGLLGGFTTFSAFSLDAVTLIQRGNISHAFIYIALSVIVSIMALFIGLQITRNIL
ncbi:MAG: fluoride efflux transporter CrcB [Rickettsiales bacterium]|nr:fluoride efflux transporter CrcB [Pseudomonadota bacterium]MDA0966227.1 fluoride efflux transporter CrcB [Pseudomonadota bacterium]MDG4543108.1 fluoride efflux transporter CrcB [Rickettsiales bacterium]MDG4545306.1 fluoride efflux transporter CrcB [Rickettsiales bacterium]MDG4547755.1 fluoride efflux transporter CrcB [Rickettsiales bacterium]